MSLSLSVIIADTDRHLRNVLRVHLGEFGFSVFLAADGLEAEAFATRMLARLVILDAGLPRLSAYDACARIRRQPGYGAVPILLLTMTDLPKVRAAAQRAGASAVLVKPFSVNDLLREIEPFMGEPDGAGAGRDAAGRRSPGFAEPPAQIWAAPPKLEWKFGEGSELTQGRRMLELLRARPAPSGKS